jgi:hypothetical protein
MNKWLLALLLAAISVTSVYALPSGPTGPINVISSERYPTWGSQTVSALAGNVTQFDADSSTITRTWQGYFGDVTGIIVLGDSNNNTLYDWQVANPQGEIYAVRSSTVPAWLNVRCSNTSELVNEDTALGVTWSTDEDAVNRTFVVHSVTHPTFYVSSVTITNDTCPVTGLYNSSRVKSDYFKEVLLSDGSTDPIIYTTLIAHTLNPFAESDGFDGNTHDFEMIVGENGHGTNTVTSTYYFYLELE